MRAVIVKYRTLLEGRRSSVKQYDLPSQISSGVHSFQYIFERDERALSESVIDVRCFWHARFEANLEMW